MLPWGLFVAGIIWLDEDCAGALPFLSINSACSLISSYILRVAKYSIIELCKNPYWFWPNFRMGDAERINVVCGSLPKKVSQRLFSEGCLQNNLPFPVS